MARLLLSLAVAVAAVPEDSTVAAARCFILFLVLSLGWRREERGAQCGGESVKAVFFFVLVLIFIFLFYFILTLKVAGATFRNIFCDARIKLT